MPESVLEWGIMVVLAFQGLGDWLIGPMNLFTATGGLEFYLLVLPAIYWCYDNILGLRLVIVLMLSIALNLVLKLAWHDPRPYWLDSRVRLLTGDEPTFGIPSGHSQNAVIFWGILAAHFKKGWGWAVAILIILFTGFSRVYLGVHFPTDVLVGWVLGIIVLVLFLQLESPLITWLQQWGKWTQVGLIFAASLGLIAVGAVISSNVAANWTIPPEWIQNAALPPGETFNPLSLDDLVISVGAIFGLTAALVLFDSGFDPGGPWSRRIGRYIVGIIGVIIIWRGLGIVFGLVAPGESLVGYSLRYIRYALIGAWVATLAPILFIRLGLAERKPV